MRTVKLNVFEEQRKWINQHSHADRIVFDAKGTPVQAVYISPLEQWKGLIAPDGTVNVPDMDYYNAHPSMAEMLEVIDELRNELDQA